MSSFAEFQAYKEKQGCADCKIKYPHYILEFDHRQGKLKIDNVHRVFKKFGREAAWNEARKCDVVCSNCHKQRSYERENR